MKKTSTASDDSQPDSKAPQGLAKVGLAVLSAPPHRAQLHVTPSGRLRTAIPTLFILLASLITFSGCTKAPEAPTPVQLPEATKDGTPVVAMAGETPITLAALQVIAAQNSYDLRETDQIDLALRDAVNNEILALEADRLGYTDDPEIQRLVKAQSVRKLLLATVDAPNKVTSAPSDDDLRVFYDENITEFTSPTVAKAQLLGILNRKSNDEEKAATQAKIDTIKLTFRG